MTTQNPLVSAIIIVLNGAEFIAEAIDSIIGQTWTDWELIVVDDGSTDQTVPLVRSFIDRDPATTRLVQHADGGNHGMSASRNLGLSVARGRYVGFLDADDVWLPNKLAEQVAVLEAEPATGMIYGRTRIWHSWEEHPAREDYVFTLGVPPDATYPPPLLFRQLLGNRHQTPTTCNALIRADVVADVGGFDPDFTDLFEDQLFFAKVLLRHPVHVSGQSWALYRQHPAATSAGLSQSTRVREAQLRYLRALRRHLRTRGHHWSSARRSLETTITSLALAERLRAARRRVRGWLPS